MSDESGWTGYAPVDGPPRGTHCVICQTRYWDEPERQWAIHGDLAVCGQCVKRLSVNFARDENRSVEEWSAEIDPIVGPRRITNPGKERS
jgi:hypothetical protein